MPKVSEFLPISAAQAQLAWVVPIVDPTSNAIAGNMIITLQELREFMQAGIELPPIAIEDVAQLTASLAGKADSNDLGTAAARNTGTTSGTIPLIGEDDLLDASIIPTVNGISRQTFSDETIAVAATSNQVVQIGTLTAPRTVILPLANTVQAGSQIQILDESGTPTTANCIRVSRSGSIDTVNGSLIVDAITVPYGAAIAVSDGVSKWSLFFSKGTAVTGGGTGGTGGGDAGATNLIDYNGGSNGIVLSQIAAIGSASVYIASQNLAAPLNTAYAAPGSFSSRVDPHDLNIMWKHSRVVGATWSSDTNGIGVLVVDLGAVRTFNEVRCFQMFADSKITHLRVYRHPQTAAGAPLHTDSGWTPLFAETVIGAGSNTIGAFDYGSGGMGSAYAEAVGDPTAISFGSASSRYLKLECRNDGRYGGGRYIELGGFKLFNRA